MPLDPDVAAFLDSRRGQPPRRSLSIEQTRQAYRDLTGPPAPVALVEQIELTQCTVRQYWPRMGAHLPLLVYFHGGRFFSGSLDTHDSLCRTLAKRSGWRLAAVDYRLAPEHPFPAAVEDAFAAIEWARHAADVVAVAGDSAGANLAAVVAPGRTAQVLVYPMIDATCRLPSHREFATEGFGPGSEDMKRGWDLYLPECVDPRDPAVSPLHAPSLAGLPPALVITAGFDPLRDEGKSYAARLNDAGVDVTHHAFPGAIHGFFHMSAQLASGREAIAIVSDFLQKVQAKTKNR